MNKNKGFTLVELIVTLLVLSIVSAMAVPSLISMFRSQNLNKSTQELRTIFTEARGKAVIERRDIEVVLNSSNQNTDTQLNWAPTGKAYLKSGSPTVVKFKLNGTIEVGTDLNFEICDSEDENKISKKIGISRMGVIQSISEGTC